MAVEPALGLKLRELSLRSQPPPPRGFFRLPLELRMQIYRHSLLEVPRWEKRHPRRLRPTRRATALRSSGRPSRSLTRTRPASTSAAAPSGGALSLLQVNRQVHGEAVDMFWTGNVFCWMWHHSFVNDINDGVRPEYRGLIRHVSIAMGNSWEGDPRYQNLVWDNGGRCKFDAFWSAVHKCSGLRSLEVRPEYVMWYHQPVSALRQHCPQLESFSLLKLQLYDVTGPEAGRFSADRRLLWFKTARQIDLGRITDQESCPRYHARLRHQLPRARPLRHRNAAAGPSGQPVRLNNLCAQYRVPDLDDRSPPQSVELRDGTTCEIQVYGLPISRATRLQHAKERMFADRVLRSLGKPTRREEKLMGVVTVTRQLKKEQKRTVDENEIVQAARRRKGRQNEDRQLQQAIARSERLAEREVQERRAREAKELRLMERKRRSRASGLAPAGKSR